MNLKEMGKEQKQYIAIGGMVSIALVVGIVFAVRGSLSSIAEARLELNDLAGKIESADRALAMQQQVKDEFAETMGAIKEHLRDAPPIQNYYSWATEAIHAKARLANLEIDTIDEQSRKGGAPSGGKGKALNLEPYSLRIVAHGGFESLKQFLELIEKDHPLARMVMVDISTGSEPEIHDVQLMVQWPFNLGVVADAWADIAVQQQGSGNPGSDPSKEQSNEK